MLLTHPSWPILVSVFHLSFSLSLFFKSFIFIVSNDSMLLFLFGTINFHGLDRDQ